MLYRFEEYSKIRDTLRQLLQEIIFKHIKMFFILPRSEEEKEEKEEKSHSSQITHRRQKVAATLSSGMLQKRNHVFSFAARKDFDSGRSMYHLSFVLQYECELRFSDSFLIYQWQNQRITEPHCSIPFCRTDRNELGHM